MRAPNPAVAGEHQSSGVVLLRTPLLPHDAFEAWGSELTAAAAAESPELSLALDADVALLRARLLEQLRRPEVGEALLLAAPGLAREARQWLAAPQKAPSANLERSLVRYFSRMCTRCTPFGTFAGVTALPRGERSRLRLAPRAEYRRKTRIDNGLLAELCRSALGDAALRRSLRYRANTSLYEAGGRVRYAEQRSRGGQVSYQLVEVEHDGRLWRLLESAREFTGAQQLAAKLMAEDPELSLEQALEELDELAACQLLEAQLAPPVTGDDALASICEQLRTAPHGAARAARLEQVQASLEQLDRGGLGAPEQAYQSIIADVTQEPTTHAGQPLQVDLYKPAPGATLGHQVTDALRAGVEALRRLCGSSSGRALEDFRERFEQRFGGRAVPLLQALDEDVGVGFDAPAGAGASPLLAALPLQAPRGRPGGEPFLPRHQLLLERLLSGAREGARELVLSQAELEALGGRPAQLPAAHAVLFTLAARSEQALDSGDFRVLLRGVMGPSGATTLGRFCHLDPLLAQAVRDHLESEAEQQPGAVFAEIVHLPEGRMGNVINRPCLRSHEIPLLGVSGVPQEEQIHPADLLVSVLDGRVVLRSQRLGCEVIPRLTSAHNHRLGFLPYRFLCALQQQGRDTVGWSWGPLARLDHLPRVRLGNVVFCLEQWTLRSAELRALARAAGGKKAAQGRLGAFEATRALGQRRQLPRYVNVVEGDHRLAVDFDNALSVESFVHLVKGRASVTLEELWPAAPELVVRGPEGAYQHEGVALFSRGRPTLAALPAPQPHLASRRAQRAFRPGSSWLYLKLYLGRSHAEEVLCALAPTIESALASGSARQWHFLRYGDPEFHLRLRLVESGAQPLLPLLNAALEPLIARGVVLRVQLDTYEREIERYGGDQGIELAERFHHLDSCTVLRLLQASRGEQTAVPRWQLGVLGVQSVFAALGFDDEQTQLEAQRACDSFAHEFGSGQLLTRALGNTYRAQRQELDGLLLDRTGWATRDTAVQLLEERASALGELGAAVCRAQLDAPRSHLARHYAHMFANRLFEHHPRAHEFVVYDLLRRHLESKRARQRASAAE